ncbi:hypothetical protein MXB_2926 [Myxobolus squamalis]|nr:hypothetical protein MXB_2926 [Myxobolus squamalis]
MEAQKIQDLQLEEVDTEVKSEFENCIDGDYTKLLDRLSPIATPLANKKLTKRICKLLRKGTCVNLIKAKNFNTIFRGSKAVMRAIEAPGATACIMIVQNEEYQDMYEKVIK